jgi:hypothetical protein
MNKQLLALELIKAWAIQPIAPASFNRFIDNYNNALKEFGYIDELKEERDNLKEALNFEMNLRSDFENRIDKAIKCIKGLQEKYFRNHVAGSNSDFIDLLEILKGTKKYE